MSALPELLELTPAELAARLRGPGRARAIYASLSQGEDPFTTANLSPKQRARLGAVAVPTVLAAGGEHRAPDGTLKLRSTLADGTGVESVLIPEPGRTTLCVSTQVGCARACVFCLTGTMRLVRNLGCGEILAQVVRALHLCRTYGLPRLRNVVYMGMGEPLDNAAAVAASLAILTASGLGLGFGKGHVTVSTVGPSPGQVRLMATWPARVAFSLHAAEAGLRARLVPTARHPPDELVAAFAELARARGDGLFVELTLIAGVNDREQDARAVLELFAGFPGPLRYNLLPMNPIGGDLVASPPAAVAAFAAVLKASGAFVRARQARGEAEGAACGQLAVAARPRGGLSLTPG